MQNESTPVFVDETIFSSEVQKIIFIVITALIVLGGGWWGWGVYTSHREDEAHLAIVAAKTPEEKRKVADLYSGTKQAAITYLELAHASLDAKPQEALELYDFYLKKYSHHPLSSSARFGKAKALEKLNQPQEALQVYQSLTQGESHLFTAQSLVQLARIQSEQGQGASARQTLQDLMTRFPDYTAEAKEKLKSIPETKS